MKHENYYQKIIRGCWQLSSGHSEKSHDIAPILDAIECGFTIFDCADIYLGVEELLGKATRIILPKKIQVHTKFVPDLDMLPNINQDYVTKIIERSLKRLNTECLDLVQFHWWDFDVKNYLYALEYLSNIKQQGKIAKIGLTNINLHYLEQIVARFDIASLQIQVSLFDKRAETSVREFCKKHNIKLLGYGSILGGFLDKKWIGRKEPTLEELKNRSLVKYKLLLDSACGWSAFQERLLYMSSLGEKYQTDIPSLAVAALIQAEKADQVIVGLSPCNYFLQNRSLQLLPELDSQDLEHMTQWTCNLKGDVYDEERDKTSNHAKIMKYNLNSK